MVDKNKAINIKISFPQDVFRTQTMEFPEICENTFCTNLLFEDTMKIAVIFDSKVARKMEDVEKQIKENTNAAIEEENGFFLGFYCSVSCVRHELVYMTYTHRDLSMEQLLERHKVWFTNYDELDKSDEFKELYKNLKNAKEQFLKYQLDLQKNVRKFDLSKVFCPQCFQNFFILYNISDEHDNYAGLKCRKCGYDYSFTH